MIKVAETRSALRRLALTKCAGLTPLARRLIVPLVQSGALRGATYSNLKGVVGGLRSRTFGTRRLNALAQELEQTIGGLHGPAYARAASEVASSKVRPLLEDTRSAIMARLRLAVDGMKPASEVKALNDLWMKGKRLGKVLESRNVQTGITRSAAEPFTRYDGDPIQRLASAVRSGATPSSYNPIRYGEELKDRIKSVLMHVDWKGL